MKTIGRWLAEHWIALGSPIVSLIVWEWASATGVLREAFFPRPSTVLAHLVQLAADGTLWAHTARSLVRIGWAFALAAVFGVGIGLAMGLWRRLRDGLDPVFAVIYPIPSVLYLPLVSFLVPPGEIALIVTTAVTSFFLIAFTTTHGVRQIDRLVVEAAVHYGARGPRLFAAVLLPGALPFIFTGLRLGLGFALIVVVAVEIVSASRGLGALLWLSWQILKVEDMYATFFVIALLGAVLSHGLAALRARLLPWVPDVAER
ncbi:MAG: ABC transporter permease [Candidatus Rokuibacteriota bacterium]|nr:MAG: ABC transporter permease [Candidatus Rokubacteria bacterium]